MGIQGLLPFLKDATTEIHIRQYSGRCVAVDTYCWLHRGAFACADKLAKGEKTDQYVNYCMKFVGMLESYNVRPILVFDGCHLPSKKQVEKQRRERRELYLQKGRQFLRDGRLNDARDAFTKCISVTPQMALDVMKAARARGVDCIVAPYEADAQLAYLLKHGYAQAVVTEDSDLLCFGCEKVILKMDLTGRAQEVSTDKFENVKNLQGFTLDTFRHMCILSGCDYLPNIKGVGLVKSCKALKLAKNKDIYQAVRKLHHYIKGLNPVEAEYAIGFERADNTFLYQLVLDPKTRKVIPLHPYPPDVTQEDVKYAGLLLSDMQALQIAWGNMDVNNGKRVGNFDADVWLKTQRWNGESVMRQSSIWQNDYLIRAKSKDAKLQNGVEKNGIKMPSLRGQEVVIDVRNLLHARKKKKELLGGEEALELCSQASKNDSKGVKSDMYGRNEEEKDVVTNLVGIYAPTELPTETSSRQKIMTTDSDKTNRVVKSRFFSVANDEPSFIEESEASSIPQVDETPETSNNSFTDNPETLESDEALSEILQQMQAEAASKMSAEPQKQPSLCSIKSPKKQRELLVKLREFQKRTEVRTPLRSSSLQTATSEKKVPTPVKRKVSISNTHHLDAKRERRSPGKKATPPCLKKFKRRVVKPPTATTADHKQENRPPEDGDRELDLSSLEGNVDEQKKMLDASIISNEAIPILDEKPLPSSGKNCQKIPLREKKNLNDSETAVKRRELSVSSTKYELSWKKSKLEKALENADDVVTKLSNSEPIVLSSEEENESIPLLDNLPSRTQMRRITLGLNRSTPPQEHTRLVKSKYFGSAKASGLRKKSSQKSKKKLPQEILKGQPKITTLFATAADRRQPRTTESPNTNRKKIEVEMMTTRNLFCHTPK